MQQDEQWFQPVEIVGGLHDQLLSQISQAAIESAANAVCMAQAKQYKLLSGHIRLHIELKLTLSASWL